MYARERKKYIQEHVHNIKVWEIRIVRVRFSLFLDFVRILYVRMTSVGGYAELLYHERELSRISFPFFFYLISPTQSIAVVVCGAAVVVVSLSMAEKDDSSYDKNQSLLNVECNLGCSPWMSCETLSLEWLCMYGILKTFLYLPYT